MDAIKKYNLVFFDSFIDAKADSERIRELALTCEQLNVVIREEGNMDDPDLLGLSPQVKVFAGKAWALIHERRVLEGWYEGNVLTGLSSTLDLKEGS
jgi:hypothetical protein